MMCQQRRQHGRLPRQGPDLGFRQVDRASTTGPRRLRLLRGGGVLPHSALRTQDIRRQLLLYYGLRLACASDPGLRCSSPDVVVPTISRPRSWRGRRAPVLCRTQPGCSSDQERPRWAGPPGSARLPARDWAGHSGGGPRCQVSPAPAGGCPPAAAAPVAGRTVVPAPAALDALAPVGAGPAVGGPTAPPTTLGSPLLFPAPVTLRV